MKRLSYVSVTQGTASRPRFSRGNTLPLTQLPFGMAGFSPQTTSDCGNWFYHPDDRCLEGVRLTHQPSPWIGDYGAILLMPQSGYPQTEPNLRWSGYFPEKAELAPHRMRLEFLRSGCLFELTPTERGAVVRMRFSRREETPYLSILRVSGQIGFGWNGSRLDGWTDGHSSLNTVPPGYRMYFTVDFDGPIDRERTMETDGALHIALGAQEVTARLAISYISREQAACTLSRELSGRTFGDVEAQAAARWEELLGRIDLHTDEEERLRTFYSCLYRVFLYPHKFYEYDPQGRPLHYDPYSDSVKHGILYTDNGFWDTYRTVYSLLSIVAPEMLREILPGYLQIYKNSGWMPKWPSLMETGAMPGTLIDAVLADAAVKDLLTTEEMQTALEGLRKHGEQEGHGRYGRPGLKEYLQLGYVPVDYVESVNCTQDYAYGDYCIARVAEKLGNLSVMKEYDARAKNYRHLFDPSVGFMRARDRAGNWVEPFDPLGWGGAYTEGGPWQNSFAVFHDIDGLAELHGGRAALVRKLDELFAAPPEYRVGGYGVEIHEMTEMAAADFGQCAISNQPSFHLPWLYAALGEQEKAAHWVDRLCREAFSWKPDGFPGDEDTGTTAAWYVFACLGFYPLCPGKAEYVVACPSARRACIAGEPLDLSGKAMVEHQDLIRPMPGQQIA